jgi:coiled-coil domain-containing protein 12
MASNEGDRLNRLKNLINRKNQIDNEFESEEQVQTKPILKFRNYETSNPELIAMSNLSESNDITQKDQDESNENDDKADYGRDTAETSQDDGSAKRDDEGFEVPSSKIRKLDTDTNEVTTVEDQVNDIQKPIIEAHQSKLQSELDVIALAPTQLEWDLKSDLDKRMKKLNKLTQRKVIELTKLRLNPPAKADN